MLHIHNHGAYLLQNGVPEYDTVFFIQIPEFIHIQKQQGTCISFLYLRRDQLFSDIALIQPGNRIPSHRIQLHQLPDFLFMDILYASDNFGTFPVGVVDDLSCHLHPGIAFILFAQPGLKHQVDFPLPFQRLAHQFPVILMDNLLLHTEQVFPCVMAFYRAFLVIPLFLSVHIIHIQGALAHVVGIKDIRTALQGDTVAFLFLHQAVLGFLLFIRQLTHHLIEFIHLGDIAHLIAGKLIFPAISDAFHKPSDRLRKIGDNHINGHNAESQPHQNGD